MFTVSAVGYVPYGYKMTSLFFFNEILGFRRGEVQVLGLTGCRSASASVGSSLTLRRLMSYIYIYIYIWSTHS